MAGGRGPQGFGFFPLFFGHFLAFGLIFGLLRLLRDGGFAFVFFFLLLFIPFWGGKRAWERG